MSLCFEDVEVARAESLPDAPYIHLAPQGACLGLEGPGFGCIHFKECRGTVTHGMLARSGLEVAEWDHDRIVAHVVVHLGVPVAVSEVEDGLAPRVERLLCAMYPLDDRWCPGS